MGPLEPSLTVWVSWWHILAPIPQPDLLPLGHHSLQASPCKCGIYLPSFRHLKGTLWSPRWPPWPLSMLRGKGLVTPIPQCPTSKPVHAVWSCFCTAWVGSLQLSTQGAHSHVIFYLSCSLLQIFFLPPACRRFSAPKTSRQPGFQCSFNEKPAWKSLRPAGHRMANKHTWISLPALFFLLGYI